MKYRIVAAIFCGFALIASLLTVGGRADAEPAASGATARVWFLRALEAQSRDATGAAPTIFASGMPIGRIPVGTAFYRDLPAGTYRFTVEPYGLPTEQNTTVQLLPGTQTYLQVLWEASWRFGYPEAGSGFSPNTFVITPMSQQLALAYLPTLAYIGAR